MQGRDSKECGPLCCMNVSTKVHGQFDGSSAPTGILENSRDLIIQNYQDMVSSLSEKNELVVVETQAAAERRERKRAAEERSERSLQREFFGDDSSDSTRTEDSDDHYGNGERSRARGRALAAKHNETQRREQAQLMQRRYNQSQPELKLSTIVSLMVDDRDVPRGSHRGILGVVFDFRQNTGGIQVVTPTGIVRTRKADPWFCPRDKHEVKPDNLIIGHPELLPLVSAAKGGNFCISNYRIHSIAKAYKGTYGNNPIPKRKCGCKRGSCSGNCGCKRQKLGCGPKCSCRGTCHNPFNDDK